MSINVQINVAREALDESQNALLQDPTNPNLQQVERNVKDKLSSLLSLEESMLKQKSRDKNLKLGDGNYRYFHGLMKCNQNQHFIHKIADK